MTRDLGLLVARLGIGLGIAAHGAQKALGWFEGPGPDKAAGFMESLGLKPGTTYAAAASYNEIVSGMLIALGLGGPLGPAGVISTMIVAAETVHKPNGFFAGKNGIEVNVLYGSGALALASAGYGAFSLDHVLGLDEKLKGSIVTALTLGGGVAAAYLIAAKRDASPPDGTLATPTMRGADRNGAAAPQPSPAAS